MLPDWLCQGDKYEAREGRAAVDKLVTSTGRGAPMQRGHFGDEDLGAAPSEAPTLRFANSVPSGNRSLHREGAGPLSRARRRAEFIKGKSPNSRLRTRAYTTT